MASLENSQGKVNRIVSRTANVSGSNDPQTQYTDAQRLRAGAELVAAAKTLGMDEDQLFSWLNTKRELEQPERNGLKSADIHISPSQKLAQLTATLKELPAGEPDGARTVSNEQADIFLAGGEQTQDTVQNFGGFDPKTGRQKDYNKGAEEISNARRETRDLNAFSITTRVPGSQPAEYRQKDVYVEDGRPTPPSFREEAMYRDAGITRGRYIDTTEQMVDVRTPRNKKGRRLEGAISQEKRKRANYSVDYTGDHVRPTATTSAAPGDALERLLGKIDSGEIGIDDTISIREVNPAAVDRVGDIDVPVYDLIKKLRAAAPRTEDGVDVTQRAQVRAERERGAQAVRDDGARFSPERRFENWLSYKDEMDAIRSGVGRNPNARQGSRNITLMGENPLPGGLTAAKATTDSYFSAAQSALSAEAMRRRPEAVFADDTTRDYADFYGFSQYVDANSGESVPTSTTGEAVNAPGRELTGTQQWVADHAFEPKGQDAQLQQANISQAQADWARGAAAHAPGYRHKPVTSIEELETQIGRVIEERQNKGQNFYIKGEPNERGVIKNKKVENPGIAEVLQLFRMGPQDQDNLANAILQQELGRANQNFGPQPKGISTEGDRVQTGTMFGAEDLNLTRSRDSQAARFGSITGEEVRDDTGGLVREAMDPQDLKAAQQPFIGSQGTRETPRSRMVTKNPNTGKARTPDQAVAAYKEQRKKNKAPVDAAYAEKIRRDNAGLRADQAALEENQAVQQVMRQADAESGDLYKTRAEQRNLGDWEAKSSMQYVTPANNVGQVGVKQRVDLKSKTGTFAAQETSGFSQDISRGSGGGGAKPPTAVSAPTPAPEPNSNTNDAVSRALKTEIAARVDQQRAKRRRQIGGAAGAGAGIAAVMAALSGGQQEEQY